MHATQDALCAMDITRGGALDPDAFGVRMPDRTMQPCLRRWGYTPRRPKHHAAEQQLGLVREWMQTTYPAIAERAKAEKAVVLWGG